MRKEYSVAFEPAAGVKVVEITDAIRQALDKLAGKVTIKPAAKKDIAVKPVKARGQKK